MPDQLLDGQPAVDGSSERHVPLRPALKLQNEHVYRPCVERPAPPDRVGVPVPQLVVDELPGQPPERRIVDLVGPLGDLGTDEELDHPGM